MPGIRKVKIDGISLDDEIQPRAQMSQETVNEYMEAIRNGAKLPPVTIFRGEYGINRLADGWNRVLAHKALGIDEINADVRTGDKRDAILFAVGANATHGQQRTQEDKRRAIWAMLRDPEWSTWSDNRIGECCNVTNEMVTSLRAEFERNAAAELRNASNHLTEPQPAPIPESLAPSLTPGRVGADGKIYPAKKPKTKVNGHDSADPPDVAKARANGRIPAEAVVTVVEPDAPTKLDDIVEDHEERAAIQDEQSVADWVRSLPLAARLEGSNLRRFTLDAVTYRLLGDARKTFAYRAGRLLAGTSEAKGGEYCYRVRSFLRVPHPIDWRICPDKDDGGCGGVGLLDGLNLECPKCRGRGYWIPK